MAYYGTSGPGDCFPRLPSATGAIETPQKIIIGIGLVLGLSVGAWMLKVKR